MSAWDPRNVFRAPGRLVMNPTSLAAGQSYPWGGAELGVVREVAAIPNQQNYIVRAEEYGGVAAEVIQGGESWVLVAVLASYDKSLLAKLFNSAAVETATGRAQISFPGSPGTKASGRSLKLLFSPDDFDHHPMLVLYNAIPLVEESARIKLSARDPFEIPVAFHGTYDGSSRLMAMGMRQGLTL